jgi:hypothetical protein
VNKYMTALASTIPELGTPIDIWSVTARGYAEV